jgi:hypothetical protein
MAVSTGTSAQATKGRKQLKHHIEPRSLSKAQELTRGLAGGRQVRANDQAVPDGSPN